MKRSRFLLVSLLVVVVLMLVAVSFEIGQRVRPLNRDDRSVAYSVAYTKAMLAVTHYRYYGYIAEYLEKKCYDDALTMAKEQRNLQMDLLAKNLGRTGNDPSLLQYIKLREPELLTHVLAGHIPEVRTYTTKCILETGDVAP
jgi:hypothetical protein